MAQQGLKEIYAVVWHDLGLHLSIVKDTAAEAVESATRIREKGLQGVRAIHLSETNVVTDLLQ